MLKEVLGKFHGRAAAITREESNILGELREMRSKSRLAMKAMFNANFGSTFLTDTAKESAFAYNVQRYADVYTSRLENFLFISSDAWLYTPFDVKILPHHIKVISSPCVVKLTISKAVQCHHLFGLKVCCCTNSMEEMIQMIPADDEDQARRPHGSLLRSNLSG